MARAEINGLLGKLLRCRSNEVLKLWGASMHEQKVVEMPMTWHDRITLQLNEWSNERKNQWTNKSRNDFNDSTKQGSNKTMNQWSNVNESINRWTNQFANFIFQKCSETSVFWDLCEIELSLQSRAHFADLILQKCSDADIFYIFNCKSSSHSLCIFRRQHDDVVDMMARMLAMTMVRNLEVFQLNFPW